MIKIPIKDTKFKSSRIFYKAYLEYHNCQIRKNGESENAIYFIVTDLISKKDHQVVLKFNQDSKIVNAECDCTIQTNKGHMHLLCSHMIGSITMAMFQIGRRKKIKQDDDE